MKKVVIFLAEGFEEIEALTVVDVLRRANISCDTCSLSEKQVKGAHNVLVEADKLISELNINEYDVIVLPGGMPGSTNLKESAQVVKWVKEFNKEGKIVSAICAAPIVLGKAKIVKDKKITSYPGFEEELKEGIYCEELVVEDGNIITSRGPATAAYFALKLVERLVDKNTADTLKEGMLLKFVEEKTKSN
ncbi:DJ-1 family glyoxalase III [Clostridium ganghwense]|uniref:DJ-1/PfpI family protein n=1 Tax=Clostridium ganghwense TaxID=312089 RepID=A0ABT4CKS3_9CLOT|nr:DJ-1 family glyoxalase III [Clostridium ganghwense]MCY6369634.1 DJ-1/PfpI family protein [Clostridium ganghwense]